MSVEHTNCFIFILFTLGNFLVNEKKSSETFCRIGLYFNRKLTTMVLLSELLDVFNKKKAGLRGFHWNRGYFLILNTA